MQTERHLDITLFDERATSGGRTRSFVEKNTGDIIDNGQHLMMGCYTSTLRYASQIGTSSKLSLLSPLRIPFYQKHIGTIGSLQVSSKLPVPANLLFGILSSDLLAGYEKLAALRFGSAVMLFSYDKRFADSTCKELFSATYQPETLIKKLWEPIILATLNASIEQASAQLFLNTLRTVFLMNRKYSSILMPTVGLSELLIDPAIKLLQSLGHRFQTGKQIVAAHEQSGVVYLSVDGVSGYDTFDALIIAASPMPQWASEFISQPSIPNFSPIVNAYLWLDKKIVHHPINGFIDTDLQWCFPKTSKHSKQLIACTVSAANEMAEQESEQIVSTISDDLFASIGSSAKINHSVVLKEKRATYLMTPHSQQDRPPIQTRFHNIQCASDFVQNALPMTIEGAIRNGQRAARNLFNDL